MLATSTAGLLPSARLLLRGPFGAELGQAQASQDLKGRLAERDPRFPAPFAADPPGGTWKMARVKSRDEHLIWAKQRALVSVDRGDFTHAVTGLRADLAEHPLTKGVMSSDQALRGFKAAVDAALGRGSQALTKWIEDFK